MTDTDSLADLTLRQAVAGGHSAAALVEACLHRIEARDPELRAFITVCADHARAAASERDRERAAGRVRGTLHGVPVAIKDTIDTRGVRTTGASRQFADRIPRRSAAAVERLEAAGAIVIGKTNTHELGLGAICAPTRNARDPSRLPGASSGGSAVAVAAGMAFGALGSDTGGSIRIPASFNGVVGLKPSYGLVPTAGTMPLCPALDHVGPLTRTAPDAALMLAALSGRAPRGPGGRLRIGVPREARAAPTAGPVATAFAHALSVLSEQGHRLVHVSVPELLLAPPLEEVLVLREAHRLYSPQLIRSPELFEPDVRELLERGRALPPGAYEEARGGRMRVRRAVRAAFERERLDLLACPTVENTAPPHDTSEERLLARVPARTCVAFNLTGQPAVTVPCGADPDGMPIGLTLAAGPGRDAVALAVAEDYGRFRHTHISRAAS